MKRIIELYLCRYRWARKFYGGRWVTDARYNDWVTFNDEGDERAFNDMPEGLLKEDYTK